MTAETFGETFAFARSLALHQAAGHVGGWFAPGWSIDSSFEKMPNHGRCECGAGFSASDVYHYSATCDKTWHTRYECKPRATAIAKAEGRS